jgi:hypothetical protein
MNTPVDTFRRRSRDAYFPGSRPLRRSRFDLVMMCIGLAMVLGTVIVTLVTGGAS